MATIAEVKEVPQPPGRGRVATTAEVAVAMAGREGFAPLVKWVALAFGVTMPLMPLLRVTYLSFLFLFLLAAWLIWRGERLADFGFAWPRRWGKALLWGVGFFLIVLAYAMTLEPLLDALLTPWFGPSRGASTFHEIRGNLGLFLYILPFIWLFAAVGEEFFYRGYLMTRLEQLFGGGRGALAAAIVIQAILFGLGHLYQGWTGVIGVTIYGLFNGVAARVMKGTILPSIIAHGLLDTLGFTMIYLGAM